ncbi:MAG: hypothetical protein AAGD47_05835 [Pseudomonadota bacterium]
MTYDVPARLGPFDLSSTDVIVLAAVLPIVIALMIGLRREVAVFLGLVSALALIVYQ